MQVKRKHRILSVLMCIALIMSFSYTLAFAEEGTETAVKKIVVSASADQEDISVRDISDIDTNNDASETAAEQGEQKTANKDSFFIDGEPGYEDDYIDWNGEDDFTINKGDKLHLDFSVYDTWERYYTIPAFDIWSLKDDECVFSYNPADSGLVAVEGDWSNYAGDIDIGSADLEPGYYFIAIQAMPCNAEGVWAEDLSMFEIPEEYADFVIK
jgi:hypothetical protein